VLIDQHPFGDLAALQLPLRAGPCYMAAPSKNEA
jgi:hypothetical protein